ncbi:MAG: hypothetical protein Q8K51_00180, partial [Nitrospirota bacterium]|nr:hypothetical protein [Nitrospirota bacterium]
MTGAQIFENIRIICGRISHAAIRAGRKPEDIKLIAVTKTISIQQIKEAIDAGLRIFGESKVQEAKEKIQDSRCKIQDAGFRITDRKIIMHHASCIVVFILVCLAGCKGKESPKPVGIAPPPQEVKTATPEPEKKDIPFPQTGTNQPPRVDYIDVIPLYPKIGDTIKITAKATDPDGDEIKLIYQWFKNEEPLSETSDSLVLTKENFKRGDNIS